MFTLSGKEFLEMGQNLIGDWMGRAATSTSTEAEKQRWRRRGSRDRMMDDDYNDGSARAAR